MSFVYNPFTGNLDDIGAGGSGAPSPWLRFGSSVTQSSTGVVDSVANTSFQALKYIISVFNEANTSYQSFEYNVLNNNGSYKETRSHRLNAGINIRVNTNNNAGTFELQIQNNETFDVQVEIGRLVLA